MGKLTCDVSDPDVGREEMHALLSVPVVAAAIRRRKKTQRKRCGTEGDSMATCPGQRFPFEFPLLLHILAMQPESWRGRDAGECLVEFVQRA